MEEHALQSAAHAGARRMDVCFVAIEVPEEKSCKEGGHAVGCCDAHPHAVCTPNLRENEKEGDEEYQLSADGHEDALLRHTDALEEVARHNLEAHDG